MKRRCAHPEFLLVGNGPYVNRGCEAIVRSSVELLSGRFPGSRFVLSSFGATVLEDAASEADPRITHKPHTDATWCDRLSDNWWRFKVLHRYSPAWQQGLKFQSQFIASRTADCILEIGGDNYTLDYGKTTRYVELDDALSHSGKPMVLWGCSVGPFSQDPEFESLMRTHLRKFALILARETETVSYLASIGIQDNVRLVADPAFTLIPSEPRLDDETRRFLDKKPIGLNLSPILGNYIGGNPEEWLRLARECISALVESGLGPVLLVPHVTRRHGCDHQFMMEAAAGLDGWGEQLAILPLDLTAAEYKHAISGLKLLAAARTHATIASLSSSVPTLSIGYSQKSRGINRDLFGHLDFLLPTGELNPGSLVERASHLCAHADEIRDVLNNQVPRMQELAKKATDYVALILDGDPLDRSV